MSDPKILLLDIETAPKVAYVWQFWKEHVHPDKVISDGYIMSIAWKWLGQKGKSFCVDCEGLGGNDLGLVHVMTSLLDEADIVIAHNAKKFDLPMYNARAVIHGVRPPSPYRVIDTLEVARKKFKFDNNSLGYLAKLLKCTPKEEHKKFPGFTLWRECLAGNEEAWEEMRKYNEQDVDTLEEVYLALRPWMDNHPNVAGLMNKPEYVCPKCGSVHLQRRGYSVTNYGKYQRFQCVDCGGWSRSRYTEKPVAARKALLANAAVG